MDAPATDLYAVLGVAPDATAEDIGRAYRALARRHHPDLHPDDPAAEPRFQEIAAAYQTLRDPARRAAYDRDRQRAAARRGWEPTGGGGFRIHVTTVHDEARGRGTGGQFRDVFGSGFGTGWPFGSAAGTWAHRARGQDVRAELTLSLAEAARGTTTEAAVGSDTAGGDRRVRLRVSAGVEHDAVIRVPGRGAPGSGGAPPGDLYVHVSVTPDPVFTRQGRDLVVTAPITYPEAVLGAEVPVPTIDGTPVVVRVPPGTPSGRVLRVRGGGVGDGDDRGDLLVRVEVAVPAEVSAKERRAVEALAKAMAPVSRQHLERRS